MFFSLPRTFPDFAPLDGETQKENSLKNLKFVFVICLGSVLLLIDAAQNKAPFKKEPNLEQWSEKFMLGNKGAALKENVRENGTKSSRSELRICSILSPQRAVTVPGPAAAKVP